MSGSPSRKKSFRTFDCDADTNGNTGCTDTDLPFCDVDKCSSVRECSGSTDITSCVSPAAGVNAKCNSENKCVKECDETSNGNKDCSNPAYPFCASGVCENKKTCTLDDECKGNGIVEYFCKDQTTCQRKNPITSYLTKSDATDLIRNKMKSLQQTIDSLKTGDSSTNAIIKAQR